MSVVPEQALNDSNRIEADLANVDEARAGLASAASGFDPESATGPAPAGFSAPEPKDQWNNIVGMAPILAAFGAIGGVFGRTHGIAMLQSTNAMMQGMVQGNADAYSDARKQYEYKYDQYRDKMRTFNDTYKAYTAAYKGRVDVADRAYKGAIAALGMDIKGKALTESQVARMQKLNLQLEAQNEKIRHNKEDEATARIRADSMASRADTARKEAEIRAQQVENQTKTADSNQVVAIIRGLQTEANTILKQYPPGGNVKIPEDLKEKLNGIRDAMDIAQARLNDLQHHNAAKNDAYYNEARSALQRGAPRDMVIKRFKEKHPDLDADKI